MQPVQNEGIGIVERAQIERGQLMPEPLLLKVEEAARRLSLSRTKVYELMESGELPSIKIGTARRIPRIALDEFIARQLPEHCIDASRLR
jgi:excisionase family DNA binding protein